MPPLLAAVTNIADATGTEIDLTGVEQMRIGTGLTATRVTNNGPPYVLIRATAVPAPDVLPFTSPVAQAAFSSSAHPSTALAFSSTSAPSYITGVTFVSGGAYTAGDTNYIECTIYDATLDGLTATPLGTVTGTITAGTGDWIEGREAFTIGLGYALPSDHRLVAAWTQHGGSGAACPGGSFRVT